MKTYTTGDIAKLCDVNLRTVIRWIERGSLKGFKLPGRGNNRVHEDDLLAFLTEYGMPVPSELQRAKENTVLIVDDEAAVAKAISRTLRGSGYKTDIASDGFEAGAKLWATPPILMTLDLKMPGLDGYKVIEMVRESPEVAHVAILVVSALEQSALDKAIGLGADGALQKPFDNRQLLHAVSELV